MKPSSSRPEAFEHDEPHVLLVDDDREGAASVAEHLAALGIRIVQAHDGFDALSCLYARRPTAVVLDLMMPRMDGLEVIGQIRGERAFAEIPIVAISGAPEALAAAKLAGAHVLAKPVDASELFALLGRLAQRPD
jgi:CheY-like chemotaxis protein